MNNMNQPPKPSIDGLQDTVELDVEAIFRACDEAAAREAAEAGQQSTPKPDPTLELAAPGPNGEKTELWPVVGGVAAGEVLGKGAEGKPELWHSFGGSLWGVDESGRPIKLRDKWG